MSQRGTQKKLINSLRNRVNSHFNEPDKEASDLKIPDFIHNSSEVLSQELRAESDRSLVTEVTFFKFEPVYM